MAQFARIDDDLAAGRTTLRDLQARRQDRRKTRGKTSPLNIYLLVIPVDAKVKKARDRRMIRNSGR